MMNYVPSPIPTDGVALSGALAALTERLAENTHDLWAERRLAEGWTFGPNRDDVRKTHPGLVPYADLSESEKEYDRRTTMLTLKAILVLGYAIVPPTSANPERGPMP